MRTLVIGADRLGRTLARELLQAGDDVRILDASGERLARLPAELEGRSLHGSPLERETLFGALGGCDALAAVTRDDALNIVVALAARRELAVPLVVAVVGNPARAEALQGLGAQIVCPTTRTAREVQRTLERSEIESELDLGSDAAVFRAELPVRLAGRSLAELARPGVIVPLALERDGRILLAAPELRAEAGDILYAAASARDVVTELVRP